MKEHGHTREQSHLCDRCSRELAYTNEMLAARVDLWTTASNLLKEREFTGDDNKVTPDNVLDLSIFLAGENNGA